MGDAATAMMGALARFWNRINKPAKPDPRPAALARAFALNDAPQRPSTLTDIDKRGW